MLPVEKRAMQGVWLLLLALSVFFFSSILLYVVYILLRVGDPAAAVGTQLKLPPNFLFSTVFLIGVSGFLHLACRAAKRNQESQVKNYVFMALALSLLFSVCQSEAMYRLIAHALHYGSNKNTAYVFTFVLAFLHALHVIFGVVGLVLTWFGSLREKYDHERSFGLKFCAIYWHFLDVVWLFLMGSFFVAIWALNNPVHFAVEDLAVPVLHEVHTHPSP